MKSCASSEKSFLLGKRVCDFTSVSFEVIDIFLLSAFIAE